MIIIWGWRAIRKVLGSGRFFCPQCGGDTDYKHLALRRWFTIFFIPIIPLKDLGTCVECSRCRTAFTERVLDVTTLEVFAHHQGLANRAVVAHLVSLSPPVDDTTVGEGLLALASAPGVRDGYDGEALSADVSFFADPGAVAAYLRPIAAEMTIEGREEFLRRMIVLVARLPHAGPSAGLAIEHVAAALAVSPAHLAGIRQHVQSGAPAAGGDL
ncbi:zinc ribbon domain-containing protein [Actinotalea sp. M2MS4P-6]|uniref:zinc ribbon domain-containing protein n=1 Tax=Actinotalea sp. M2MS4P-6 TaxID=2983762 RepID=UPI0021E3BF38|nr:zinc ribbon domain-containing protein [Actinotalea sp. M2MS4P-6]MCV2393121.1 zinc ribbon domain-containing protein [Actinotalea sp. M2MS4P-6]